MKRILFACAAFAVALVLAAPAAAGDDDTKKKKKEAKKGGDTAALFAKLDANQDGKLSRDEFAAFKGLKTPKKEGKEPPGVAAKRDEWFKKLDANGDGALTVAEFGKLKEIVAANPPEKKKKVK